jgi:hypothetical protein
MQYGFKASNLAERVAFAAKQLPMPLIDTLLAMLQTRSIMAAMKLGIFEAMRDAGPHQVADLARQLQLDAANLELLLRVLVSSRYLRRSGSGFELSSDARLWLLKGAKFEATGSLLFCYHEWEMLGQLEELIKSGQGIDFHATLSDPQVWGHYQRSMLEISRGDGPILAGLLPLPPGSKLLLDIAGSHGLKGAYICRKHPGMRSIVLDLAAALPHARKLAEEAGILDVVEHREGDMLSGEFPGPADAVLYANILHHFSEEHIVDTLTRGCRALRPGGVGAIWDAERRAPSAPAELASDAMALFFRLTSNSQVFEDKDYVRFMQAAGFKDVRVKRSLLSPVMVLVHGSKA